MLHKNGIKFVEDNKSKYIGAKIIDIEYDYFTECMMVKLDNNEIIYLDIINEN